MTKKVNTTPTQDTATPEAKPTKKKPAKAKKAPKKASKKAPASVTPTDAAPAKAAKKASAKPKSEHAHGRGAPRDSKNMLIRLQGRLYTETTRLGNTSKREQDPKLRKAVDNVNAAIVKAVAAIDSLGLS